MHEIDRGDHIVALAGDWHGDTDWAIHVLALAAEAGIRTVHHLGDFGIYVHRGAQTFLDVAWSRFYSDGGQS